MNVLVLCTGNSCRSQMAEGYLKKFAGNKAVIYSAGIEAHGLNPYAVKIMAEDGVDISDHTSKTLDDLGDTAFDFLITVCDHARESCPHISTYAKKYHHSFPDPARFKGDEAETLQTFREVRNQIKVFARNFTQNYL